MDFTASPGQALFGGLLLLMMVGCVFLAACLVYFLICAHRISSAAQRLACVAENWLERQSPGDTAEAPLASADEQRHGNL
jgi:hypothetical protein